MDRVDNAQQSFRRARQAPVVFQREEDAAFLGPGQASLYGVDAPLEPVVFPVTGKNWFHAAMGHERVEIDRVPAPGVDADAWDAKLIGDLDALLGVLHVLGDFLRLRA